jgi:hypothetical protein
MVAFGSALALWRAGARGTGAALAAYGAWHTIVLGVGVLAALLAGGAAARDRRQAVAELVLAKPGGSAPELVVLRFLGVWLSVMTAAALILVVTCVGQLALGRTPWHLQPYLMALVLCAIPLALASAFGFLLSSVFAPLSSGIAATYWVAVPLARPHTPTILDLTLSQHWLVSVLLSAALVMLAAGLYARPVRGRGPSGRRSAWLAVGLFLAAGLAALAVISAGEDALMDPDPVLSAMSAQTKFGSKRAPGFWLPGRRGPVEMSEFSGRPVALAFWSPAVPSSARTLAPLAQLAREYRRTGLSCVAICLDRDSATMPLFARELSTDLVLVWDRGQHFGKGVEWSDSPLAVAYDVSNVPTIFVLDRRRALVSTLSGEIETRSLRGALSQAVAKR